MNLAYRYYRVRTRAVVGLAVAPCKVADMSEYRSDVSGTAPEKQQSGNYRLALFDHFISDTAHDFLARIKQVGAIHVVFYSFEGLFDLFEFNSRTELHCIPMRWIGSQRSN